MGNRCVNYEAHGADVGIWGLLVLMMLLLFCFLLTDVSH